MARRKSEPTDGDAVTEPGEAADGSPPAPEPSPEAAPEPFPADPAAPGSEPAPEPAFEPVPQPDAVQAELVQPDAAQDESGEEYHEGPSFAARALTWLLLLLAGAAIGIWGAPRLAPLLPSGLAPVANWLTPGQENAEARIAEVEAGLQTSLADLQTRLAAAESGLAAAPTPADVSAAVTSAVSGLSGEITELRDAAAEDDGAEARQRLARAESAIDGQAAELAAIKAQIAGGAAAAAGALSAETTERIDLYRAELEGLRAEMGGLSDKVAGLATRIDEVAAAADRQVETARAEAAQAQAEADTAVSSATVEADLAQVRAAIAAGLPFADAAGRLGAHPDLSVPEPLLAASEAGVPSLPALRDGFPDAAHDAIRASIMAGAGDGVFARSRAFLDAQIASRSLTPQPGASPDAVLSRMEDRLRHDDLAGALAEADALPSEATAAMAGWLDAARARVAAEAALATLASGAAAGTN